MEKTVTFSVNTGYVGSTREATFSFEDLGIDENLQGEELEKELEAAFQDWLWENIDTSYKVNE